MIDERNHDDAAEAAQALAADVAAALRGGIARRGAATLAVSPRPALVGVCEALHAFPLDWSRVQITLTDEAWVAPGSPDSGEQLLRRHLLRGDVLDARLVSLWQRDSTPIQAAPDIAERLSRMARPFDAVVLDVGEGGRIAALHPGMAALDAMLNPNWAVPAAPARAPGEAIERVTLTLRSLLDAMQVHVLVAGAEAREAYASSLQAEARSPLRSLLAQRRTPVRVHVAQD